MDDLMSEDWQNAPRQTSSYNNRPAPVSSPPGAFAAANFSPPIRASPSGTASPLNVSRPSSTLNGTPKPAGTNGGGGGDAFGSLLGSKAKQGAAGTNVSIQEKQRQLVEERRRQQEAQGRMWESLGTGSGKGTPAPSTQDRRNGTGEDEDDILAAFNKAAPVDRASHFPPPSSGAQSSVASGTNTPALANQPLKVGHSSEYGGGFDDDDDPFGLGGLKQSNGRPAAPVVGGGGHLDDDDVLGDLGKPVTDRPIKRKETTPAQASSPSPIVKNGEDQAIAELVDMGFPADTARIALAQTDGSLQSAVGWLLEQAHAESRQKAQGESQSQTRRRSPQASRSPQRRQGSSQDTMPAWMRQEGRASPAGRRQESRSPGDSAVAGDKDPTQVASEYGSKFLKGAGALWKSSQKQMAKTLRDFQEGEGGDPNQPKWMRDTSSADSSRATSQRRQPDERVVSRAPRKQSRPPENLTNEAAMLDAPRREVLPQRPSRTSAPEVAADASSRGRSPVEPTPQRHTPQPRFMQQAPQAQDKRAAQKLSRQAVEEESAQAYISPARRKRPTPQPTPQPEPEVDLFSPAPAKAPAATSSSASRITASARPSPAITPRPQAPPRNIPPVSASALATSAQHRKAGTQSFKRGDYASAHESYTAAMSPLPPTHPVLIVVLANRALTGIKTGDSKTAVADADKALDIIGPTQGTGESIDLMASGEGTKDMKDFFGKVLTRKAEALEHLEKWKEAAAVWRQAVEVGVGGANAIRNRDRCEKAATPAAKSAAATGPVQSRAPGPRKPPLPKGLGNSLQRPTLTTVQSAEAVKKLREANAAAERADDEKFALTDSVDAKLLAWKGGKADNLRALLQSMDTVLWPEAGWKKVGMQDLVMTNKVKIVYMRAIGKVHPDKIPQNASTEQRMVSAAVFATLNEAWDKFKKENNM